MGTKNGSAISRREFARRAAIVSAAASLSTAELLRAQTSTAAAPTAAPQSPATPNLSAESQIEAQSRIEAILAQYGNRLSDAQKVDLTRLSNAAQPMLDRLRAYPVGNSDGTGLYLKPLMEREKKPAVMPSAAKPAVAPKKS
ncbi:MAG TPA: hypothetical protein VMH48_01115 [Methylomirabilota bacterium]|nr:hypothetical protein [Methylomirabilota bacterium]